MRRVYAARVRLAAECNTVDTEHRRANHGRIDGDTMKAYLITTGTLFALLALAHVAKTVAESWRLTTAPGFLLEGPGIGIIAAALALWAWRLLRRSTGS